MTYAFLFPGQGSQTVGMGKDLAASFEIAASRCAAADEILGRRLTDLMFAGPAEELAKTANTQPALFTIETAICDILAGRGIVPSIVAGHSLGEYSALYAAGVFSFDEGLRLVAKRGELMAAAGAKKPGAMAAVIGFSKQRITEVLREVSSGIVAAANENTPEQTVISGETAAVSEAAARLKAAGAKKVVPLAVSGAFHSPLMQEAADAMRSVLATALFAQPRCPVIANVTARRESDPQTLKELLVRQLVSPVRWVDSMKELAGCGCDTGIEAGPGSVLTGLAGKCGVPLNVVAAGTAANLSSLLENNR